MTLMTNPSGTPALIPQLSANTVLGNSDFINPSAIGERIMLWVQANNTVPGKTASEGGHVTPRDFSTQIRLNNRREVLSSMMTLPSRRSRSSTEPSLWSDRRPISID